MSVEFNHYGGDSPLSRIRCWLVSEWSETMKYWYWMLVLVAVGCTTLPEPEPPDPPDPPKPEPEEPADASCATACENQRFLECEVGDPTPEGSTCEEVCEGSFNAGVPGLEWNVDALTRARDCKGN